MTNRVVLGALPGGGYGLRVSRPGYNVLDVGLQPKQVSFDSRWTKAGRVFMRGTKRTTYGGSNAVSYGTTFSTRPTVFMLIRQEGDTFYFPAIGTSAIVGLSSVTLPAPFGPPASYPDYYDVSYIIMWPYS